MHHAIKRNNIPLIKAGIEGRQDVQGGLSSPVHVGPNAHFIVKMYTGNIDPTTMIHLVQLKTDKQGRYYVTGKTEGYVFTNGKSTGPQGDAEWQEFINCLTTNLTSFFREDHHFTALATDLQAPSLQRPRIWCSAASTGEEPYTIAITVAETLGANCGATIVASDIDTKVLATAEAGVYDEDARGLSPERLRRHFLRGKGQNAGHMRIKPELARMVEFRPLNLMDATWSLGDPFDIIFCRNVMIYFDGPTQRTVLERMHRVLKPNGLLYVGHSENFSDARDLFRLRGKTIYQRV